MPVVLADPDIVPASWAWGAVFRAAVVLDVPPILPRSGICVLPPIAASPPVMRSS